MVDSTLKVFRSKKCCACHHVWETSDSGFVVRKLRQKLFAASKDVVADRGPVAVFKDGEGRKNEVKNEVRISLTHAALIRYGFPTN